MMIRTQVYLPTTMHSELSALAHLQDTSISELIRQGAQQTIQKHAAKKKKMSQKKPKNGLAYFAHLPKSHLMHSSISAVDLVRAERD